MTGPLPFAEAIDFWRGKTRVPTDAWHDIIGGGQARAFTVAGANTDALLMDFQAALSRVIAEHASLADFQREFDSVVATHGWDYHGSRGWRSTLIYNVNLRVAHAAGRWLQIQQVKGRRPYLRYSAILDSRTRPLHREWHGIILPVDHPWWHTHYPPCGWNCRCTVQSLSEADLKRFGWAVSPDPVVAMQDRTVRLADGSTKIVPTPEGIDTGWGYNVGMAWTDNGGTAPVGTPPAPAPEVRKEPEPAPDPAEVAKAELSDAEAAYLAAKVAVRAAPTASALAAARALALSAQARRDQALDIYAALAIEASVDAAIARGAAIRAELAAGARATGHVSDPEWWVARVRQRLAAGRGAGEVRLRAIVESTESDDAAAAAMRVRAVADWLPRSWVEWLNQAGKLHVRPAPKGRAWCAVAPRTKTQWVDGEALELELDDAVLTTTASEGTTLHELGHWLQAVAPLLDRHYRALHQRRTKGEDLVPLARLAPRAKYGPGEVARRDKYLDPYYGKEYSGSPLEVLTMALQDTLADRSSTYKILRLAQQDPQMLDLTLGLLFGVDP